MEITATNICVFIAEHATITHYKITFPGKLPAAASRRIIKEAYPQATFVNLSYSKETCDPENLPKMIQVAEFDLNK